MITVKWNNHTYRISPDGFKSLVYDYVANTSGDGFWGNPWFNQAEYDRICADIDAVAVVTADHETEEFDTLPYPAFDIWRYRYKDAIEYGDCVEVKED